MMLLLATPLSACGEEFTPDQNTTTLNNPQTTDTQSNIATSTTPAPTNTNRISAIPSDRKPLTGLPPALSPPRRNTTPTNTPDDSDN